MFYDIYMRPAGSIVTGITAGVNPLEDWDLIDMVNAKVKLNETPELKEMADGTSIADAVRMAFECGTLNVAKYNYLYLRDIFHNELVDVMLLDVDNIAEVPIVHGMRCKVDLIHDSGNECEIKISAEYVRSVAGNEARNKVVDFYGIDNGVIQGVVCDDIAVPQPGVEVTFDDTTNEYIATTDHEGFYRIIAGSAAGNMKVTGDTKAIELLAYQVYVQNLVYQEA